MNYKFPKITHLRDILPAIQNSPEFIVMDKGQYKTVRYVLSHGDTFPPVKSGWLSWFSKEAKYAAIRRECRGLVFDKDGRLISRRLHKFFNLNEKPETQAGNIDLSKPHVILEKLDGSMITPLLLGGEIRWATKSGLTDTSKNTEAFVKNYPEYERFARYCFDKDLTPIFEWCSRKNPIVIDHPKDRLVLIAIRELYSGAYKSYEDLNAYGQSYGIEVVKTYPGTIASMQHLIDNTREAEGIEGWIIRFDDGHMIKLKGEWYCRIHRAKEDMFSEKAILRLIFNDGIDDIKAMLPDEDRKKIEDFESKVAAGLNDSVARLQAEYDSLRTKCGNDRKAFAAAVKDNPNCGLLFAAWGNPMREIVLNEIRKHLYTRDRIDKVRVYWGSHRWNYGEDNS